MSKNQSDFFKKIFFNQQAKDKEFQHDQFAFEKFKELRRKQLKMLKKSGIIECFEKVVADGYLRLSDKPVIGKIYARGNFKSYETEIISDYTPAAITISVDEKDKTISISLLYDHQRSWLGVINKEYVYQDYHSEIRFLITGNTINLVYLEDTHSMPHKAPDYKYKYNYIPFYDNLDELMSCGLSNPLIVNGSGFNLAPVRFIEKPSEDNE